jgi:hypothetical protein
MKSPEEVARDAQEDLKQRFGRGTKAKDESAKANGPDYDKAPDEPTPSGPALRLTFFADLSEKPTPKPWLIKNVIARDETSSWIAPPGKGKSALLTDIAVHLAGGFDWRGYRTKAKCGVVYFALERADLVRRRLIAHKLRDDLRDLPIAVASEGIDLLNRNCADVVLATIHAAEQRFGLEVGLAIFDTCQGHRGRRRRRGQGQGSEPRASQSAPAV